MVKRLQFSEVNETVEIDFSLSDSDWLALEKAYMHEISKEARENLLVVCDAYFQGFLAEKNALPLKDIKDVAKYWLQKSKNYRNLTHYTGQDDKFGKGAVSEFEHRLDLFFETFPLHIAGQSMKITDDMPDEMKEYLADHNVGIKFNGHILSELSLKLYAALLTIKGGHNFTPWMDNDAGFADGKAWANFLNNCVTWAKRYGLPSDVEKSRGIANDLPYMVFELRKYFPEKFRRNPVDNPNALAEQMRKKINAINKRKAAKSK